MQTPKETPAEIEAGIDRLLNEWSVDPNNCRVHFRSLRDHLAAKPDVRFAFHSRPGISHSLRAQLKGGRRPLFAMIDVVDDDPEDRWLSVCFYGDMITDPEDSGDLVPGGLLGEDGHCFDLDSDDSGMVEYLQTRIDEAYRWVLDGLETAPGRPHH